MKKSNILMVNLPFAGHTNPTLPLAEALVRRGHHVTYVNAESFRQPIEVTGARFVPYRDFPADISEEQKKRTCFRAAYDTAMSLDEPFDLLLYEMFFHPGFTLAQRMGIPCVRQFSQPAWSESTWKAAPSMFRFSAWLIDRQMLSKDDIAHMGLTDSTLHDGILHAKPALNIVYLPEAFQPCRESLDDSYCFTVPEPAPQNSEITIPLDTMKKPLVYISLGSIISNKGFCKECIRAFGGREYDVILSTGKVNPDTLGNIPANIHAYSYVPQVEVLRHADVFLTHCGMNSVNEALRMGVPMVAMPFMNDQLTNAARLVELGLAERVRSFPSSGRELRRAVERVAGDTAIKARCEAMRRQIETGSDWEEILLRIERIAARDSTLSSPQVRTVYPNSQK